MPHVPDTQDPHSNAAGGFSRWQYHQDQMRQQWAHHQYLALHIEQLRQELPASQAPVESLADEIMRQVLGRYDWKPRPRGRPRLVKGTEAPQRRMA
jgi:hypothetical protein